MIRGATVVRTAAVWLIVLVVGCSSQAMPSSSPSSRAAQSPRSPSPAIATSASSSPAAGIGPGEPWIVFQRWTRETGAKLRLMRPDGSGDHPLFDPGPGEQTHPDWSPDGSRIAYVVDNDIWAVDVDGSDPERLFDCEAPCIVGDAPSWSPDGQAIAFVSAEAVGDHSPGMKVMSVDVRSKSTRTLVETVGPDYAGWVRWSPDGSSLVLGLARYPDTKVSTSTVIGEAVAVVDLTAAEPALRLLTDWAMGATYPDWSWANDRIVFSTFDLGFRDAGGFADTAVPSDLYTIKPDGTDLLQLTHNATGPTAIRNGTASGPLSTQPTWAPDGSSITFVQVEGETWPGWGMARINADGSAVAPAAGSDFLLGTHPRLRPTP